MRYTRHDADVAFTRLCMLLNKTPGKWNEVGAWQLDYNATYGGYVVNEISTPGGGVRTPLGDRRMVAREFCEAVWFAERCAEIAAQS